jgi:Xaa-Pro aminopeptidase
MKKDLDELMIKNNIDCLIITGAGDNNPDVYYFTGGAHLTQADIIKIVRKDPVIFYHPIERDNAEKTGLQCISYSQYPEKELLAESNNSHLKAQVLRYKRMLSDLGLKSGRIAIYGKVRISQAIEIFSDLVQAKNGYELVSAEECDVLMDARATKDAGEIKRIKKMGQVTVDVVNLVADFLSGHSARNNILIKTDGSPLTIGEVKNRINYWLMERGAENPQGTIFSIGRDAGVPHTSGENWQTIELGSPIVFDIFPCEAGGGYFYDLTRTWCLGYAADDVLNIYQQVLNTYETVRSQFRVNVPFSSYQKMTCELFEEKGHGTVLNAADIEEGYIHGIGHGVGLNVHEKPSSNLISLKQDILVPGMVFTLEPGLYYPSKNIGVRLEDTYWIDDQEDFNVMAEYPKELILPIKS